MKNCDVKNHIFGAVKFWIEEFKIDGLRFDAADVLDKTFIEEISQFTRNLKENFWLTGEVVHGNYNDWVSCNRLDSVTNYQLYRSIFASVDQNNFFDISYNLKREFGMLQICASLQFFGQPRHRQSCIRYQKSKRRFVYDLRTFVYSLGNSFNILRK